jgi:hypothetical protein
VTLPCSPGLQGNNDPRQHYPRKPPSRPPNVIFTEPPTGAATPYLGAGAVPGGSILRPGGCSPGAADRPDPAFAKKESATAASRRRQRVARLPVGAAPTRQGIKTSPKCQRESTAETPNVIFTEPPTGAATR